MKRHLFCCCLFWLVLVYAINSAPLKYDVSMPPDNVALINLAGMMGLDSVSVSYSVVSDPDIQQIEKFYRKGQARERHNVYMSAYESYKQLIDYTLQNCGNISTLTDDKAYTLIPYLISAAYRMGFLMPKLQKSSILKLYDQLEMYREANEKINDVITYIADIKYEKNIQLNQTLYGMLYYSKGYNKISMVKTLIAGNVWKDYVIYMPSDIIALLDSAIYDMDTMLNFCKLSKVNVLKIHNIDASIKAQDIDWNSLLDNQLTSYMLLIPNVKYEFKTLQLSYHSDDPRVIKDIVRKRIVNNVYPLMDYYYSENVQKSLGSMKEIKSLDSIKTVPPEIYNIIIRINDLVQ